VTIFFYRGKKYGIAAIHIAAVAAAGDANHRRGTDEKRDMEKRMPPN
jgi:hypothetical protein